MFHKDWTSSCILWKHIKHNLGQPTCWYFCFQKRAGTVKKTPTQVFPSKLWCIGCDITVQKLLANPGIWNCSALFCCGRSFNALCLELTQKHSHLECVTGKNKTISQTKIHWVQHTAYRLQWTEAFDVLDAFWLPGNLWRALHRREVALMRWQVHATERWKGTELYFPFYNTICWALCISLGPVGADSSRAGHKHGGLSLDPWGDGFRSQHPPAETVLPKGLLLPQCPTVEAVEGAGVKVMPPCNPLK